MSLALPLDAHLHTDISADADVPIDAYAALARRERVAELAITDHLDFDPRLPNYAPRDYERRARIVRDAAERWDGDPEIRFGVEITYESEYEQDIRAYLARHAYDYVIGSVHVGRDDPARAPQPSTGSREGDQRAASAGYFEQVERAIGSGLFDTIGHLDFVKRYLIGPLGGWSWELMEDVYEQLLRAVIERGVALEVNSSGLRQEAGDTYPPAAVVERYRALGGERVVAGSDAHRIDSFGFGLEMAYRTIAATGVRALAFRRGAGRVAVALPDELVESLGARRA